MKLLLVVFFLTTINMNHMSSFGCHTCSTGSKNKQCHCGQACQPIDNIYFQFSHALGVSSQFSMNLCSGLNLHVNSIYQEMSHMFFIYTSIDSPTCKLCDLEIS